MKKLQEFIGFFALPFNHLNILSQLCLDLIRTNFTKKIVQ